MAVDAAVQTAHRFPYIDIKLPVDFLHGWCDLSCHDVLHLTDIPGEGVSAKLSLVDRHASITLHSTDYIGSDGLPSEDTIVGCRKYSVKLDKLTKDSHDQSQKATTLVNGRNSRVTRSIHQKRKQVSEIKNAIMPCQNKSSRMTVKNKCTPKQEKVSMKGEKWSSRKKTSPYSRSKQEQNYEMSSKTATEHKNKPHQAKSELVGNFRKNTPNHSGAPFSHALANKDCEWTLKSECMGRSTDYHLGNVKELNELRETEIPNSANASLNVTDAVGNSDTDMELVNFKPEQQPEKDRVPPIPRRPPRKDCNCIHCGTTFKNVRTRSFHENHSCASNPDCQKFYHCAACGIRLTSKENYISHRAEHEKNEFQHVCVECGKPFRTKTGIYFHRLSKHTDTEFRFECAICGKRFFRKIHWENHMSIHSGSRSCQCDVCGKQFTNHKGVMQHMKTVHQNVYRFHCDKCGHGVNKVQYLTTHQCGRVRRPQKTTKPQKEVDERPSTDSSQSLTAQVPASVSADVSSLSKPMYSDYDNAKPLLDSTCHQSAVQSIGYPAQPYAPGGHLPQTFTGYQAPIVVSYQQQLNQNLVPPENIVDPSVGKLTVDNPTAVLW